MKKLEIFDPAMCCSTGVCGPSVNPELTRVASAVYSLEQKNFDITRYNLGNDPGAFVDNDVVNRVLIEKGPNALPLILVNNEVVKEGAYPKNEELAEWLGVKAAELQEKPRVRVSLKFDKKGE
ncbi:arsenite efflux transporter metallochaperone ArsD [Sporosarcina sp. Marseille-Q4063]|uniref:arsenite efflux transporter metallochaperone ArsD n=1 Tax=Sporosarcina sp. Marseille-Q4063 TaxID=2810514 RepID=UPI001BB027C7|nr:arsenite efflux transporter metallochaperone ArsD [Sporosarcina sp. Marseille-Q4063]QUW20955.1 arsenite efflux transporter metallochaperone ArsD [Sporosarcina sp. Marseille-Q4063]